MSTATQQAAQAFTEDVLDLVAKALDTNNMESLAGDLEYLQDQFVATVAPPPQNTIAKVDNDQRMVWGWASVSTQNGQPVVDRQGDILETVTLQKAAHNYITNSRGAKVRHNGEVIGEVVDSIVFTDDIQKALGIDFGQEGWFIGMRIDDDATLASVDRGEFPMFSIGGEGTRVPTE